MIKSIADNASPYNKKDVINKEKVEPDTVSFSSKFYAPNHIPSYQERPGNNTLKQEVYTKYVTKDNKPIPEDYSSSKMIDIQPEYNLYCYKK